MARKALVVGIAKYSRAPLRCTVHDATKMHAALCRIGFSAQLMTDCDFDTFHNAVDTFIESLNPGDSALFYFAGHGVEAAVQQGLHLESSNWLISRHVPQSNDQLPRAAVDAQATLERMKQRHTHFNLLILDCCRDNPLPPTSRSLNDGGLLPMMAPAGSLVAFACAPRQKAVEPAGKKHGLYTWHLLKHIETPGLRVEDLFIEVGNRVRKESEAMGLPVVQDPYVNSALTVVGLSLHPVDGGAASCTATASPARHSVSPLRSRSVAKGPRSVAGASSHEAPMARRRRSALLVVVMMFAATIVAAYLYLARLGDIIDFIAGDNPERVAELTDLFAGVDPELLYGNDVQ
eukprot:3558140-Prymnesium_polylepis.1